MMIGRSQLVPLFDKIRSICKESNCIIIPQKLSQNQLNLDVYLKILDQIRSQFVKYRTLQEDYGRLEVQLQNEESVLRTKVANEQQNKLYVQTLKGHIDDLAAQKLNLLQTSKQTMKELKRVNQQLFAQLESTKIHGKVKNRERLHSSSENGCVTDRVRAFSLKKSDSSRVMHQSKGIGEILKTQYIQMGINETNSKVKKIKPISNSLKSVQESAKMTKMRENSKTFQIFQPKTDREYLTTAKKRHANHPIFKMTKKQLEQQLKGCYLPKSPQKEKEKEKIKKIKGKIKNVNRSLWKDKLAHRSVTSISSMEPVVQQKETL